MVLSRFIVLGLIFTAFSLKLEKEETFILDSNFQVMYFSEQLDHMNRDSGLINIRALVSMGQPSAPLFVYLGGNNPIEFYYNNAGWLTNYLQPTYNATVVFIEHRYYGDSAPLTLNYEYLTTSQALYDFADIVTELKPMNNTAVIAFGGVYSGMLAAFFRIKYSHIVDGAIASSAPLLAQFDTLGEGYARVVTKDYFDADPFCSVNIVDGFNILDNLVARPALYTALEDVFKTCQSINDQGDVLQLEDWLSDAFKFIAEYDYPYISNVRGPLPPYPVNVACGIISNYNQAPRNMWTTLYGMYEVANMYYNFTGRATCFDIYNPIDLGPAWTYQQCTELSMPSGSYGPPNDMFPERPWSQSNFNNFCLQTYGVTPKPEWIGINYGMSQNANETLQYASNIVFTYGQLDPHKYSCIQDLINLQTTVFYIKNATAAVDLRTPSPQDPQQLIYIRGREEVLINQWVQAKSSLSEELI